MLFHKGGHRDRKAVITNRGNKKETKARQLEARKAERRRQRRHDQMTRKDRTGGAGRSLLRLPLVDPS